MEKKKTYGYKKTTVRTYGFIANGKGVDSWATILLKYFNDDSVSVPWYFSGTHDWETKENRLLTELYFIKQQVKGLQASAKHVVVLT